MDQSITLTIAGKVYPLKAATPEMEQAMRIAAEAIGKRLAQYDAKYPDKDLTDKLVFVALNESVNRIAAQRKFAALEDGEKKLLDEISSYLDSIDRK